MIELEQLLAEQTDKTIAVAVHDLPTRKEICIQPDQSFHPASTIKVHVMMEVFHQAEHGLFRLEDHLPITNSFTSIADGSSFSLAQEDDAEKTLYPRIGQTESIRELTRLMIVRSSNLATNILLERIQASKVNDFIQALGIPGVAVIRGIEDNAAFRLGINNRATARGLTETMKLIAEGKVISTQACEDMIEILLGQEFNESIPALLPGTAKVAHKTGWTGNVYHDTGIVYPEGRQPYAISIMTRGFVEAQEDEAHTCMARISKIVYDMLQ
ncbi:MAG TPA: serine hydrolase [Anaerolineales bacterium]|nr:serine hydrolase [Anaerolineales bacterium]